jgi:hypothetical protein
MDCGDLLRSLLYLDVKNDISLDRVTSNQTPMPYQRIHQIKNLSGRVTYNQGINKTAKPCGMRKE